MAVERPRKGFARFIRFCTKNFKIAMAVEENRVVMLEERVDYLQVRLEVVERALFDLKREFENRTGQSNGRDESIRIDETNTVVLSNSIPVTPTWNPLLFEENSRSGYCNNSNPWLGGVAKVCSEINSAYESNLNIENESVDNTIEGRVNLVGKEIDKAKEFLEGKEQGMEGKETGDSTSSEESISRSEIEAFQALSAYPEMPTDDGAESGFANLFDYKKVFKPSPEKWLEYKSSKRYKRARDAVNDDGKKLKEITAGLKECVRSYRKSFGPLESANDFVTDQSPSKSSRESEGRTVSNSGLHESFQGNSGNGSGKATCSRKRAARGGSTNTSHHRGQRRNTADVDNLVQEFLRMRPIPAVKGKRKLLDFDEVFCSWEEFGSLSEGGWLNDTVIDTVAKICREESRAEEPSRRRWYLPTAYSYWILARMATIRSMISQFRISNRVMTTLDNCEQIFIPIHDNESHWYLIVLDFTVRKVLIFDSKKPSTAEGSERRDYQIHKVLEFTQSLLTHPSYEAGGREFGDITQWPLTTPVNVPQQQNDYDCGMFLATFMMQMHLYSYELVEISRSSRYELATLLITHQLNKERTKAIEFMKEELKNAGRR